MLTRDYLKMILEYNPDTGVFKYIKSTGGKLVGSRAGSNHVSGYRYITCNSISYREHRVVWLYIYGTWPKGQLDHINGNKSDNRINNLREVSNKENCRNKISHKNGRLLGTSYHKQSKKWCAFIHNKTLKKIHIGLYLTEQEAHEAYLLKRMELGL
jgi:hypothetical protein